MDEILLDDQAVTEQALGAVERMLALRPFPPGGGRLGWGGIR